MSKSAVTCSNRILDGGGAQILRAVSCLALAHDRGLDYVHTPLASVAHNDDNNPHWTEQWNHFFNLSQAGSDRPRNSYVTEVPPKSKKKRTGHVRPDPPGVLYVLHDALHLCRSRPEIFLPIIPIIREAYDGSGQKPALCYKRCLPDTSSRVLVLTVACHIRRGDIVHKHSKHGAIERLVPCSHFANVLTWVREIDALDLFGTTVSVLWDVHVYSQGDMDEFEPLLECECITFHLNEDVFSTFHHLCSADVLIMSRSDFSFVAGLLSKGTKLFCPPPFWHAPVPGWLECDEAGMFKKIPFLKSLRTMLCGSGRWSPQVHV